MDIKACLEGILRDVESLEKNFEKSLLPGYMAPVGNARWETVPVQTYIVREILSYSPETNESRVLIEDQGGTLYQGVPNRIEVGDILTIYRVGPFCRCDGIDVNGVPVYRNDRWFVGRM